MAYIENFPISVTNPDGEVLELLTSGDEFSNYLHDEYGNKIMQGKDGYYYYAYQYKEEIFPGKIKVDKKKYKGKVHRKEINDTDEQYKRRASRMYDVPEIKNNEYEKLKKNLNDSSSDFPELLNNSSNSIHLGTLNNIVVFIRFSDDNDTWNKDLNYYQNLLNGNRPSVKDYYNEVSYGKVDVHSTLYPNSTNNTIVSYQDSNPRSYYLPISSTNPNGYTSSQRSRREHDLLKNAIEYVKDEIPTSMDIDGNNDGKVDSVSFICKGNATGWGSILWGHRWALYTHNVQINGKRVWDYTFQPENQATVTIISHELFHVFGAPDLYRYSGGGISPVGSWDIMANGRGHMSTHMKYKYADKKWIENIPVINNSGKYTINPITTEHNNSYRINSPNSTQEYFLIEYRQRLNNTYDNTIPGSGLLVYRIHEGINTGNRNGPPDEVYVFRPNGTLTSNGTISWANYSDKVNRTEINSNTNPIPFLKDGSGGGLHIYNIKELNNSIEFEILIDGSIPTEQKTITLSTNPSNIGAVQGDGVYQVGTIITVNAYNS